MGWRELAGLAESTPALTERSDSELHQLLSGFENISASELVAALSESDVEEWRYGRLSDEVIATFAQCASLTAGMRQGRRPHHYSHAAECSGCGPVWLWQPGVVDGCPWCVNRMEGLPIPRPRAVACADCKNFRAETGALVGTCGSGALLGLIVGREQRECDMFLPLRLDH